VSLDINVEGLPTSVVSKLLRERAASVGHEKPTVGRIVQKETNNLISLKFSAGFRGLHRTQYKAVLSPTLAYIDKN